MSQLHPDALARQHLQAIATSQIATRSRRPGWSQRRRDGRFSAAIAATHFGPSLQSRVAITRAVTVDPDTGLPVTGEEPADAIGGTEFFADDELVLAEFEWMDPPATKEEFHCLMGEAVEALEASEDD